MTVTVSIHETLSFWVVFSPFFHPQISKELINFYDSAYIKAVDVSGSTSKDAAIKVLDVFHTTVGDNVEPPWQSNRFSPTA